MNKSSIFNFHLLVLLALVLVSCGPDNKHFAIDGQLLNLNQGEFVIYSPDGAMDVVDTIVVNGGRLDYVGGCQREGTAIIILPNGQDIPVFIAPGKTFTIKGNAQSLKDVKISGGKDNELMNSFRKDIASFPPTSTPTSKIKNLVKKNPQSVVCGYIVRHYLIEGANPDYITAAALLDEMKKARPDDATLKVLYKQVTDIKNARVGCTIPTFSSKDIDGKAINSFSISKGIWIVSTFASWDYETIGRLRRIKGLKTERSADWNILAVSLDGSKPACKNAMAYDAKDYTIVCDERMTEGDIVTKLAMKQFPFAVVVKDGKIIKRSTMDKDFMKYLKDELK